MGHSEPGLLIPFFAALAFLAAAAVAAPLFTRRRTAGRVHFALVGAASAILAAAGFAAVFGRGMEEARTIDLGPLPVPILIDGLSGLFLVVIAALSALSALSSIRYLDRLPEYGAGEYYAAFPLFVMGMAGLVVADDLSIGFTLAWQVMTVASFALIRFEKKNRGHVRAALRYLVWMEAAWILILTAGLWAGGGWGDSLHVLAGRARGLDGPGTAVLFALLLAGFGIKAGVFPVGRFWLPDAYASAPSPASALISGALTKTGIFGLIRVFFFLAPGTGRAFDPGTWGAVLAVIGVATLFIGTLQSIRQDDVKRLLAYSSIGQIGYIVLALGVALWSSGSPSAAARILAATAFLGALVHVLNHATAKSLLFLTSGSLEYAIGTTDLHRLGGLIRFMPLTAAAAAAASLSIAGMPPASGFASKWAIVSSSLLAGDVSVVLVLFGVAALFTSAVTLAGYVKYFGMAFVASGPDRPAGSVREVPGSMIAPKAVLTAVAVVQGLFPALFFGGAARAMFHSPGFALAPTFGGEGVAGSFEASISGLRIREVFGIPINAAASPLLVLALLAAAFLLAVALRRSAGSKKRTVPTWLCGYQQLSEGNRYPARGLYSALKQFFRWTGGR